MKLIFSGMGRIQKSLVRQSLCTAGMLTLLLSCTLQPAKLQAQDYVPLVINPKIGLNFSNLLIEEGYAITSASRLGWNAGFDFRYGTNLLIIGGLHVYGQGSSVESQNNSTTEMRGFTSNQLKIPVGIGYKIFRFDYFNVWLYGQGVMNFRLSSLADEGFPERIDEFKQSSIAGRFGIGCDIGRVTLELNYERGFSNFIGDEVDAKNHLAGLTLGYKL